MYDDISDNDAQPRCPKRVTAPSARVACADNAADLELSSHRQAQASHTRPNNEQLRKRKAGNRISLSPEPGTDSEGRPPKKQKGKEWASAPTLTAPTKPTDPEEVDADGLLKDVHVIEISHTRVKKSRGDRTQDIEAFFSAPYLKDGKKYRDCNLCVKMKKKIFSLINETTTLRHHEQANHAAEYRKWAKENNFESMLPDDAKQRHEMAREQNASTSTCTTISRQGSLDGHVVPKEQVIRYSDYNFRAAAVDWIALTDQPLDALQRSSFKRMIDIASRAPNGVNIPGIKTTRQAVMDNFNANLTSLKERLSSSVVQGCVNLTCDAWQASNMDGYFAVTAAWIEESSPRVWNLQTGLLGFTKINNAHHGKRLGHALFKIVRQAGITHKVGYVTCDNASNNNTMMEEFRRLLVAAGNSSFDAKKRRLRCMAHIINLATQAFLGAYSKTAHYDSASPHDLEPATLDGHRDEIGVVRAISVKAHSSPQQKALFKELQTDVPPSEALNMVLDMKIRWSSTFGMLQRALELKETVNVFIKRLAWQERQNATKSHKLLGLQLSPSEWDAVGLTLALLVYPDNAQHAFSSGCEPTLHTSLPALETLFNGWTSCSKRKKYSQFHDALEVGLAKVSNYYDHTAASDAHIIAMILDPQQKLNYIRENWGEELSNKAQQHAEDMYKKRFQLMYPNPSDAPQPVSHVQHGHHITTHNPKLQALFNKLGGDNSNSDRDDMPTSNSVTSKQSDDPARPWLRGFHEYLTAQENLGDLTIVQWWGVNSTRYPVWASLARDFLSIMASSVSAERVFSSAGITITKRRNRLKSDVVEALQFQKCAAKAKLIFREDPLETEDTTHDGEDDGASTDDLEFDSDGLADGW